MTEATDARKMQALNVAASILEDRAVGADPTHPVVEDVRILRRMLEQLAIREAAVQRLAQALDVPRELLTEQRLVASSGWCAPGDVIPLFHDDGRYEEMPIPDIQVTRGGPRFGEVHASKPMEPEPQAPSPDGSAGHWEYGVDVADYEGGDTEPEIVASASSWHWEPFLAAEEARADSDGPVVKRWVRNAGEWQVAL